MILVRFIQMCNIAFIISDCKGLKHVNIYLESDEMNHYTMNRLTIWKNYNITTCRKTFLIIKMMMTQHA